MSDMYFTSMYDRLKTGRRRSKNEGEIVSAYDAAIRASLQDVGGKTALQSGDSVSEASSSTTTVGLSALENASIKKKRPTPEKSASQQAQDKKRKRSRKLSSRQSGTGGQHRKRKSQTPRDLNGSLDTTVKLKRSNKRVSQTTLPGTEIQPEDLGAIQDQVKEVEIVRDENGDEVKIFWIQEKFKCYKEMRAPVPRLPRSLLSQNLLFSDVLASLSHPPQTHKQAAPPKSSSINTVAKSKPKSTKTPVANKVLKRPKPLDLDRAVEATQKEDLTVPVEPAAVKSAANSRKSSHSSKNSDAEVSGKVDKTSKSLADKILKSATLLVEDAQAQVAAVNSPLVSPPLNELRCASAASMYVSPSSHASSVTQKHQCLIDALKMSDESDLSSSDGEDDVQQLLEGIEQFSAAPAAVGRHVSDQSSAGSSLDGPLPPRDPVLTQSSTVAAQQLLLQRMESSGSSGLGKSPDTEQQQLLFKKFTSSTSKNLNNDLLNASAGNATRINVTNSLTQQGSLLNRFCTSSNLTSIETELMETDEIATGDMDGKGREISIPSEIEIVEMLSGVDAIIPTVESQLDSSAEFVAPKSVEAIREELSAMENMILKPNLTP